VSWLARLADAVLSTGDIALLFLVFGLLCAVFALLGLIADRLPWIAAMDDARRRNQAHPWR